VGWTLLQEMPLTSENVTNWVREVVGIGIALGADDTTGEVHITSVFPKSPAGQAGLAAGLVIKSIDGVSVAGKDSRECAELMGGPAGQSIRLEVFDRVRAETTIIELTRARYLTASS